MRLGLLGGTFDPPHIGHLIAAQDALQVLALDCVALVPAAIPPHKQDRPVTPAPERAAMLALACGDDPRFRVETLELDRTGPSYTIDTLRALASHGDELFLLIGTDQYAEFGTWREPEEVRRLATLGVLRRAGDEVRIGAVGDDLGGRPVRDVPVTRIDISSTLIREAVAAGRSIRYLVPPGVEAYIRAHGLYRGPETPLEAEGAPRDRHSSPNDEQ
ncbi:MAG: nicotinate (nicotinamide) nucleotide adenylyltransferase [Gemmatimonadetes bacterium]|nr:nicotinate (nicotinamide) nucleotide adenylyltransferase [Gemmatimonadota bacterium]